jgi:transcription elongation factor GreA
MTSIPESPLLNGRDMLRAIGLSVEGPLLWGKPVLGSSPGVFVVELPSPTPKVSIDPDAIREWLRRAPELRLDGKRPSVAELQSRLASFWVPGQQVLYIGSSQKGVGPRLAGMYRTPLGERRPQPAGYWLKTLHDLSKCRIWWAPTPDPDIYEDMLVDAFAKAAGTLPYAVLATPSGDKRSHGITGALHDDAPPRPARPTRVVVLPDAGEEEMALSMGPERGKGARAPSAGTARTAARAARPAGEAKPRARSGSRKPAPPQTGPSAIVPVVVRRSSKTAASTAASAVAPTHVTAEGLVALETELEELTTHRRPEVIARIKAARELGDLSENADYEAARKEQSFLEGRILQLEQMIKYSVIIDTAGDTGSTVVMGSTVVVETDRHGEETFQIVGSAEADAASGKISFTSPIGKALLGHRAGETVRVQVPAGSLDFKIVEVK